MKKINYLLKQAGYFEGRKKDMILQLNPIVAQRAITMDVVEVYDKFLQIS